MPNISFKKKKKRVGKKPVKEGTFGIVFITLGNFQDTANIGTPASHKHDVPEDSVSRCSRCSPRLGFDLLIANLFMSLLGFKEQGAATCFGFF